jgi:predicted transposase YbfD/YdcC
LPPPRRTATTVDKGHGRLEKRTLRTTVGLTLHQKWPGLAQGFEIQRQRTEKGQTTVEVVYGITSLNEQQADAARLAELVRNHWLIENCLHYVRDVTLREDACRVRKGTAPQVLAALRNAVVHLLSRQAEQSPTKESRPAVSRRLAARPDEALALLGLPGRAAETGNPGRARGDARPACHRPSPVPHSAPQRQKQLNPNSLP